MCYLIVYFQGTNIAAGKASGVVVGTGLNTQIGMQLKTSQHNHSMSNFGLFFFRPNELNFCMCSSI